MKKSKIRELIDRDGILLTKIYSLSEVHELRSFFRSWLRFNFDKEKVAFEFPKNLSKYHKWSLDYTLEHGQLFRAINRFMIPPSRIRSLLINSKVSYLLKSLDLKEDSLIDEGMGWLGFRLIRPGMGDGYPLSCKDWGASNGAFSFWIPLFGFGKQYSLRFVRGSNNKTYDQYLPEQTKFAANEFRLRDESVVKQESMLVPPGYALFYHPRTLHSENVPSGRKTRINLEFRFASK